MPYQQWWYLDTADATARLFDFFDGTAVDDEEASRRRLEEVMRGWSLSPQAADYLATMPWPPEWDEDEWDDNFVPYQQCCAVAIAPAIREPAVPIVSPSRLLFQTICGISIQEANELLGGSLLGVLLPEDHPVRNVMFDFNFGGCTLPSACERLLGRLQQGYSEDGLARWRELPRAEPGRRSVDAAIAALTYCVRNGLGLRQDFDPQ